MSWDEIGKAIGKKIENCDLENKFTCKDHWKVKCREHGGGFGRLVFAASVMYSMHLLGWLNGLPTWLLVVIVLGFAMMRL